VVGAVVTLLVGVDVQSPFVHVVQLLVQLHEGRLQVFGVVFADQVHLEFGGGESVFVAHRWLGSLVEIASRGCRGVPNRYV